MPIFAHATTFYFANSGSDSNVDSSPSAPFASVAKANAVLAQLKPGDSVLFKAGDVFRDDYLRCGSATTNPGWLTLANHAPTCSGVAGQPITIGAYGNGAAPVFDAADPLAVSWVLQGGTSNVYHTTLPVGAAVPQKLYVDCAVKECPQILPVPNATGPWSASRTYRYLDSVTYGNSTFVYGSTVPAANRVPTGAYWTRVTNGDPGNASQAFPAGNTGPQNVHLGAAGVASGSGYGYPAYSGAFWYDGDRTLYVSLADGSNPNSHTFEATHRPYGIVLESANYVHVRGLAFEHAGTTCGLSFPYSSDHGAYFVGENNTFRNVAVWNCGGIAPSLLTMQESTNMLRGGIVIRGNGQYNPHLVAGNAVIGSYIGQLDNYFAIAGDLTVAGVFLSGFDGGGAVNNCVLCTSKVVSVTSPGVVYSAFGTMDWNGMTVRNLGGRIAGDEFTNNQGNIFMADTQGGSVDTNYVHESYGEGIQLGGNSTSASDAPQMVTGNVLVNLGKSASLVGYNGIDCNSYSQIAGIQMKHNTIWNTWGAGATFEGIDNGGCTSPVFEGNIVGQDALLFPANTEKNGSYIFYSTASVRSEGQPVFDHNLYSMGSGINFAAGYPSFANWIAQWPETDSVVASPQFVNSAAGNWRLQSSSPARRLAQDSGDAGALPYAGPLVVTFSSSNALIITNPALK